MKSKLFRFLGTICFVFGILAVLPAASYWGNLRYDTNGLHVGTASTDKIGFYAAAPITRPTNAAQTALTDSTSGSTANATISSVALTDSSGGATADGTIGAVTAPTALTHAVGTADGTVDDVSASFNQTTLNNNFKELTTAQAADRTAIIALTDAVKELSTVINTQNANDAKIAKLVNRLRTDLVTLGLIKGS